jgi:hypothetical protein
MSWRCKKNPSRAQKSLKKKKTGVEGKSVVSIACHYVIKTMVSFQQIAYERAFL